MQTNAIPFERMKEIIETELNKNNGFSDCAHQVTVEYQKGYTRSVYIKASSHRCLKKLRSITHNVLL